jgi:formate-dependent nitrite reductase membrane component NrfD
MTKGLIDALIRFIVGVITLIFSISGHAKFHDPIMQFVFFAASIMSGIGILLAFSVAYCTFTGRYN